MKNLVLDIETDGLLDTVKNIWCVVLRDLDTGEVQYFRQNFVQALSILESAEKVWGHNLIDFDLPAIQKFYPSFDLPRDRVYDTMLAGRLAFPYIKGWDYAVHIPQGMPKGLAGRHSLEAWGYRLGVQKVGLDISFAAFSEELLARCIQDTSTTAALVALVAPMLPATAWETERTLAWYLRQQEWNGFPFDVPKAVALAGRLRGQQDELRRKLEEWGGKWIEASGEPWTPKRDNGKLGYVAGCPVQKIKEISFNPSSRAHFIRQANVDLKSRGLPVYAFPQTEKENDQLDETVLRGLVERLPQAQWLLDYYDVSKRLGYVMDGKKAWLQFVKDGRLHGHVNQMGTPTSRGAHYDPNLSQTPKEHEYRELFHAPDSFSLVGVDMSGIELRFLAHYLYPYDGGQFAQLVLEGDPHVRNMEIWQSDSRDYTKNGIYAFIYGAGDEKLGRTIWPELSPGKKAKQKGRWAKEQLLSQYQGLRKLTDEVTSKAMRKGYLRGIDGRKVPVSSQHVALNYLLQSGGAISSKVWINTVNQRLTDYLGNQGWEGQWAACVWSHDELVIAARPGVAEYVKAVMIDSIAQAGVTLGLNLPLTGKGAIGRTWADVH